MIDWSVFLLVYLVFSQLGVLSYLLALIVLFIYRVFTQAKYGKTLGMMLLKIKLSKYSFKIALKREIFRLASCVFYIGYIYALFDKRLRTFHDISSGTYVDYVDKNTEDAGTNKIILYITYVLLIFSF
ncbi:RDD family protein [Caloramator sp. mosi_1]|uniref:RDD family protein n=1 Tax=Caloramator sp. mosi_1 TaxID=3023090 RepID=UPI00235E9FFE|nr:RDD family protein [Caloramator sp. mosi_1]WDC85055.1 RDD family protein [Caloramator sp. mosi_1]